MRHRRPPTRPLNVRALRLHTARGRTPRGRGRGDTRPFKELAAEFRRQVAEFRAACRLLWGTACDLFLLTPTLGW